MSLPTSPNERPADSPLEVSVVMPCLNEADGLPYCIESIKTAFASSGLRGEIIVADNGSTDDSREIALSMGARVVDVPQRGYGHALMKGIDAARGALIVMGDADGSYDFAEIPNFVKSHKEGYDLIQGCRLPSGGGRVLPGAMPFMHRYVGNPLLSFFTRMMFATNIHDVYCGLRAFTPELYQRLKQRCTGMEFAVEMIIKARLLNERIGQIPVTLHPDRRLSHPPHLRTYRDGWRTLRFFLLSSPKWLYLFPGLFLIALGILGYILAIPGVSIGHATLGGNTLLCASLFVLCGYQAILFAIIAKTFAVTEQILPPDPLLDRFFRVMNLERGLFLSGLMFLAGAILILRVYIFWRGVHFGILDYGQTLRLVVPGTTLITLSFQTAFSSFFVSMLGMGRK